MLWALRVVVVTGALKVLLAPAYFSTDFDVHRNWMAITHSLPAAQWYHDATSKWTLDYPPLFAAFERGLAWVAAATLPPPALAVTALPYHSWSMTLFHRLSVVAADVVLVAGLVTSVWLVGGRCTVSPCAVVVAPTRLAPPPPAGGGHLDCVGQVVKGASCGTGGGSRSLGDLWACVHPQPWLVAALAMHPGLLMVDHVHFQYNGFLIGVMLLALAALQSVRWKRGATVAVASV